MSNAFPSLKPFGDDEGMTLRQYYKAAALTGIIACPEICGTAESLVASAGRFADAMIDEDAQHLAKGKTP